MPHNAKEKYNQAHLNKKFLGRYLITKSLTNHLIDMLKLNPTQWQWANGSTGYPMPQISAFLSNRSGDGRSHGFQNHIYLL